jgi:hypothetical protein
MIQRIAGASRVATLTIAFGLLFTGAPAQANDELVTLKGYIEIAAYDDEGNVAAVSIYDEEWGQVLVHNQGKGSQLLNHVDADVELTGQIVELDDDSGFSYAITVAGFKVEGADEPDEPELPAGYQEPNRDEGD